MSEIILISIPETTIKSIVEEAVKNAITGIKVKGSSQNSVVDLKGLLEVRPFIGSQSTIYKKVALGLIPHSKQGKKLFFDLAEIDNWLLSNKIKTVAELKKEAANYLKNKRR